MKSIFVIIVFLFVSGSQYIFAQSEVYAALKSNELVKIETSIAKLESQKISALNNAYLGALYMKKADHLKDAKNKIAIFKKGNQLLENEILKQNNNIELRFLRLAIQENAPKILKYNKDIDEDSKLINQEFKSLESSLQKNIKEYANTSNLLILE